MHRVEWQAARTMSGARVLVPSVDFHEAADQGSLVYPTDERPGPRLSIRLSGGGE
jgi:hypothetical protein